MLPRFKWPGRGIMCSVERAAVSPSRPEASTVQLEDSEGPGEVTVTVGDDGEADSLEMTAMSPLNTAQTELEGSGKLPAARQSSSAWSGWSRDCPCTHPESAQCTTIYCHTVK